MRLAGSALLVLATAVLTLATFLALIETNAWRVRMTDFPRLQYLIALGVLLICLGLARGLRVGWRVGLAAIVLLAMGYNGFKLYRYLPLQDRTGITCPQSASFSVLVANV